MSPPELRGDNIASKQSQHYNEHSLMINRIRKVEHFTQSNFHATCRVAYLFLNDCIQSDKIFSTTGLHENNGKARHPRDGENWHGFSEISIIE